MHLTNEEIHEAQKLRKRGWSYNKIAQWIGCAGTTVLYWCNEQYRAVKLERDRARYYKDQDRHRRNARAAYHRRREKERADNLRHHYLD